MRIIEADSIVPTPWRNGGGQTRELLAWPSAADWRLRVSVADIAQDGPFSAFPGVQRHFAVLEGAGVALALAEGVRRLERHSPPCAFEGAEAPDCRLLDGPTRDLNLMLRGLAGALRALDEGPGDWPWRALFCAGAASLHDANGGRWALAPRSLVLDLPAGAWRVQRHDAAPAYWLGAAR